MREIAFRGKDAQGRWLYGAVSDCLGMMEASPFLPGTFGELTGLWDAGGEDIYEGDIVQGAAFSGRSKGVVPCDPEKGN